MQNYSQKHSKALFFFRTFAAIFFTSSYFFYPVLKMLGFMLHVVANIFTEIEASEIESPGNFS